MHHAFQTRFAHGLLAPAPPISSKRFAVYRNNVFVSLVEALKARFPAVQNAVGAEFFEAMARDYASTNTPASPLMMHYGDSFPDFIATFPPLANFPWMADLARVECAITQSYHATDNTPLGPEAFATIAPDEIAQLRLTLHPALKLVASRFPIATLWQMNSGQVEPATLDDAPAETALIHRPHFTVSVKALSPSGGIFLSALQSGQTLGEAADTASAIDTAFDLTTHLHLLIADGLITLLTLDRSPQ
jgi:hypothetical protein